MKLQQPIPFLWTCAHLLKGRVTEKIGLGFMRTAALINGATLGVSARSALMGTAISFAVPLFAALLLGWYGAGLPSTDLGSTIAIVYWLAILLPTWFAFEAFSWAMAYVLRPLHPKFIVTITLGCLFGGLAARPFVVYIIGTVQSVISGGDAPAQAPSFIWSIEWLLGFVQEASVILLLWVGANMLMHGPLRLPRFGYAPSHPFDDGRAHNDTSPPGPISEPEFFTRLKSVAPDAITALEAEDHYVRIHTAEGSELIHYRFADAVEEMRSRNGLQVHRSFWVNKDAIESMVRRGRSFDIVMTGGKRIPVGQTFKQSAATELKGHLQD